MQVTVRRGERSMNNIVVFKFGGSSVDDLSDDFFDNISTLQKQGVKPVIVHLQIYLLYGSLFSKS